MATLRTDTPDRAELAVLLQDINLEFSDDRGWETLVEHVAWHREILRRELGFTPQWHEAAFSWYEEVFIPVYRAISPWAYRRALKCQPLGDLYLAVSDHWCYLKDRNPKVSAATAARSFVEHYGSGIARYFSRFYVSDRC